MTVVAFVYDDYYCHGILDSFRGRYRDSAEAREMLKGDRHGVKCNLEIFDLDSLGFEDWTWVPLYDWRQEYKEGGRELRQFLKHRWDKDKPEVEIFWDGDVRRFGEHNPLYSAGDWERA